jgi:two-component system chemotaxis response regulator CheY
MDVCTVLGFARVIGGSADQGSKRGFSMRALIVDDSSFLREYLRQALQRMGMACEEAVDGLQALHVLKDAQPFDVMLLDVNMPVMDGLDCVRALRDARMQPEMKVIMVTTEADDAFIHLAFERGADEFLMKPFTPQSLREKLQLLGIAAA